MLRCLLEQVGRDEVAKLEAMPPHQTFLKDSSEIKITSLMGAIC